MQAMDAEQKKAVMVSAEVHRRIVALRKGDQTYGDVVAASIQALEMQESLSVIPCIDDISEEELDLRVREIEEHPERRISLGESMRRRSAVKGKGNV